MRLPGRVVTHLLLTAWVSLAACGGGAGAASPEGGSATRGAGPSGASSSGAEAEAGEPDAPPQPRCDDGTCFPCGGEACLAGEYCDERAPGGPACSWLPECLPRPSCACVLGVLGSACRCEPRGAGVSVVCG
ncbi:MAG: hypothetical protein IT376_10355 [Polyangiaceae bacterium]|nr:hypothetical protein [Polyangiaceae bacterium]